MSSRGRDVKSKTENRKSKLIDPPVGLRNEDGQLFHHVLSLSDRADHARAGRSVPFFRHALARMTAPALDESATREIAPTDLGQLVLVQPRFTSAIDVIAIIKHETGA